MKHFVREIIVQSLVIWPIICLITVFQRGWEQALINAIAGGILFSGAFVLTRGWA